MIIPINDIELRKNTAQGAIEATIKPPTVGPITRPMLLARALSVKAAGNSVLGTSALIVGIIGVLIIVMPAPKAKVSINNTVGVVRPYSVRIPTTVDVMNMYTLAIKRIIRRSKISDNIPDGNANRKIGRLAAVVISDTNKGLGARVAISHDAPISYIAIPIYENVATIHNVLYNLDFSGLNPDTK
jgi:hypothetical protein